MTAQKVTGKSEHEDHVMSHSKRVEKRHVAVS
jgi:hypothetical protein